MIYVFSDFEVDEERFELRRAGKRITLEPKVFRVLAYLVQHCDRAVPRDEIRKQFWPGEFVTDSALAHCIAKAHQAVDDGGLAQRIIKTVHGHGYRVIAAVVTLSPDVAPSTIAALVDPCSAEETPPSTDTLEPPVDRFQPGRPLPAGERK